MTNIRFFTLGALALTLLTGCQPAQQESSQTDSNVNEPASAPTATAANVTQERLLNAATEPSQWMSVGGTYEERHYSPLNQINRDTVSQLGLG